MREGWDSIKLVDAVEILNGFAFKSSRYVPEGIRVIRISNVQKGYVEDKDPKFYPVSSKDEIKKYLLQEGDLLMSLTGNVGRVGLLPGSMLPCALNQRVACLRIKNANLSKMFLFYLLNSNVFENMCIKSSSGVAQLNMSTEWLKEQVIPFPSLPEQQRIVVILDQEFAKIDALKANAEKSLQAAKDLFQATLNKELEPKEGWIQYDLGTIADFKNGLNFGKEVGNCCFHFLGVGDFKNNLCIDVNTLGQIQKDEIDDDYLLHENDIVFVRSNGSKQLVGRCLLVKNAKEKATFSGFCIRCRLKCEDLFPQFLIHFCTMEETKQYLTSSGEGCNISNLNQRVLSSLTICAPKSREEQARIVAIIEHNRENIGALQENYQKTLTLCDDLKQSLLRKAFNGEL